MSNIAVVGAGYWGKNLVRVFHQLGTLRLVCDTNKDNLQRTKKEYPELEITDDFSKVLEDDEIKAVVIATPAITHFKLAKLAFINQKDVFVEKPLALSVKEGRELVNLAKKKRKILMIGHLLFYHPAFVELKRRVKKGELGKIRYIWSNRLNFGKLRREENVLWSFAPHDISLIVDLLGMPSCVQALSKSYLQHNIPDITLTFLKFKGDRAAHIFVSWLNPFKEQKLAVIGSKKMAVFDDQAKDKLVMYSHKVKWDKNNFPQAIKDEGKVIKIKNKEPLLEEAKHFLECIKKRKKPMTDGQEGLMVLEVLDACQRSLEKRGKIINI